MLIIAGSDHKNVTSYGSVQIHQCQNCHNTEYWELDKISKYFTLFFIPIFSHNSDYWYHCPVCYHGMYLDNETFKGYKSIAEINQAFLSKKISETEMLEQIEKINKIVEQHEASKRLKSIEDSKVFVEQISLKTTEELLYILNENHDDYAPAFIIAAKEEIKIRNLPQEFVAHHPTCKLKIK